MASTYTLSTFLRQTPKSLLQRYFRGHDLLGHVAFDELRTRDATVITEAMNRLPTEVRGRIDLDFQDIHLLADKFAARIVMDLAQAYEPELVDRLGRMENHYARAMWLYLERRRHDDDLFDHCRELVQVEQIRFSRSKRRNSLPHYPPAHDEPVLLMMAEGIKELYQAQGRGGNCQVEVYERQDPSRFYFVGYPEDYATSELEYEGVELRRRVRRSTFDVALLYRPDEGTLEIHAPGRRDEIEALQRIFCETALGSAAPPLGNDRCYDLDRLLDPAFAFALDPVDDLDRIEVCSMRLVRSASKKPRITFETTPCPLADFLRQVADELDTPLPQWTLTTVKLRAVWRGAEKKRPKTVAFSLSSPDTSDLKDTPEHLVLKRYLKIWGIAP
ncbi:MAG: hypothetical protein ABMB14_18820 [Myxococcota bacterium]